MDQSEDSFCYLPLAKLSRLFPQLFYYINTDDRKLMKNWRKAVNQTDFDLMHSIIKLLNFIKECQIFYKVKKEDLQIYGKIKNIFLIIDTLGCLIKGNSGKTKKTGIILGEILKFYYSKFESIEQHVKYCEIITDMIEYCEKIIDMHQHFVQQQQKRSIRFQIQQLLKFLKYYDDVHYSKKVQTFLNQQLDSLNNFLFTNNLIYDLTQIFICLKIDYLLYFEKKYLNGTQWNEYIQRENNKIQKKFRKQNNFNQQKVVIMSTCDYLEVLRRKACNQPKSITKAFRYIVPILTFFPKVLLQQKSTKNKEIVWIEVFKKILQLLKKTYCNFQKSSFEQQLQVEQMNDIEFVNRTIYSSLLNDLEIGLIIYLQQRIRNQKKKKWQTSQQYKQILQMFYKVQKLKQKVRLIIEKIYNKYYTQVNKNLKHAPIKIEDSIQQKYIPKKQLNSMNQNSNRNNEYRSQSSIQQYKINELINEKKNKNKKQQKSNKNKIIKNQMLQWLDTSYQVDEIQKEQSSKIQAPQVSSQKIISKSLQYWNHQLGDAQFMQYYEHSYKPYQAKEIFRIKSDFIKQNILLTQEFNKTWKIAYPKFIAINQFLKEAISKNPNHNTNNSSSISISSLQLNCLSLKEQLRQKKQKCQKDQKKTQIKDKKARLQNEKKILQMQQKEELDKYKFRKQQLDKKSEIKCCIQFNLFPLGTTKIGLYALKQLTIELINFSISFSNYFNIHIINNQQDSQTQQFLNVPPNSGQAQNLKYKTNSFILKQYRQILQYPTDQYLIQYFLDLLFTILSVLNNSKTKGSNNYKLIQFLYHQGFKLMKTHFKVMLLYYIYELQQDQELKLSQLVRQFESHIQNKQLIKIMRYCIVSLKLESSQMSYMYWKFSKWVTLRIQRNLSEIKDTVLIKSLLLHIDSIYKRENKDNVMPEPAIQARKQSFFVWFNQLAQMMEIWFLLKNAIQISDKTTSLHYAIQNQLEAKVLCFYCPNCMSQHFVQLSQIKQLNYYQCRCQKCLNSLMYRFNIDRSNQIYKSEIQSGTNQIKNLIIQYLDQIKKEVNSIKREWNIKFLSYHLYAKQQQRKNNYQFVNVETQQKEDRFGQKSLNKQDKDFMQKVSKNYFGKQKKEYSHEKQRNQWNNSIQKQKKQRRVRKDYKSMEKSCEQNRQYGQNSEMKKQNEDQLQNSWRNNQKYNLKKDDVSRKEMEKEKQMKKQLQTEEYTYNAMNIFIKYCQHVLDMIIQSSY